MIPVPLSLTRQSSLIDLKVLERLRLKGSKTCRVSPCVKIETGMNEWGALLLFADLSCVYEVKEGNSESQSSIPLSILVLTLDRLIRVQSR